LRDFPLDADVQIPSEFFDTCSSMLLWWCPVRPNLQPGRGESLCVPTAKINKYKYIYIYDNKYYLKHNSFPRYSISSDGSPKYQQ
jgi:hypothetical protein